MPWSTGIHATAWRRITAGIAVWACLVTGVGAWGLRQLDHTTNGLEEQQVAFEQEEQLDTAEGCIRQWQRADDNRELAQDTAREGAAVGALAVFDVARALSDDPSSIPDSVVDQLLAATDQRFQDRVDDILARYPDPACDLEEAQALVERHR